MKDIVDTIEDKIEEIVDAIPIDEVEIANKGQECIDDAVAYHRNDQGSIHEWADISSCIERTNQAMANNIYDSLTKIGIPYTDSEVEFFPRPKSTDVNQTFEHQGEVFIPSLTQEERAAERQKIYDKYGDGSQTGNGYGICQSYDYLTDKDTPTNVIGHYNEQEYICIHEEEDKSNPNYNVTYQYDNSPVVAEEYDYDDESSFKHNTIRTKDK